MKKTEYARYLPAGQEGIDPHVKDVILHGDLQAVSKAIDGVISRAMTGDPGTPIVDSYKRIAAQLPLHIPTRIHREAVAAAQDTRPATSAMGRKVFTMLNLKSVITVYESQAEFVKGDEEDTIQTGVEALYKEVHRISDRYEPSFSANLIARNAMAQHVGNRDGVPMRWVLTKQALPVEAEVDDVLDQNPYGMTKRQSAEQASKVASSQGVRVEPVFRYIQKRSVEQPVIVDESTRDVVPDIADAVADSQGTPLSQNIFTALPEGHAEVMRMRTGFRTGEVESYEQVAKRLGITVSKAAQLEADARTMLREPEVKASVIRAVEAGEVVITEPTLLKDQSQSPSARTARRISRDNKYKEKISAAMDAKKRPTIANLAHDLGISSRKVAQLMNEISMAEGQAPGVNKKSESYGAHVITRDQEILHMLNTKVDGRPIKYAEVIYALADKYPELTVQIISQAKMRERKRQGIPGSGKRGRPLEQKTIDRRIAVQRVLDTGVTNPKDIVAKLREEGIYTLNYTVKTDIEALTGNINERRTSPKVESRRAAVRQVLSRSGEIPTAEQIADELGYPPSAIKYDLWCMKISLPQLRKEREGRGHTPDESEKRTSTLSSTSEVTVAVGPGLEDDNTANYLQEETDQEVIPTDVFVRYGVEPVHQPEQDMQKSADVPEIEE